MPVFVSRTPSYRVHKPSGQAVVTIDGRDLYLGKANSPASRAEYDRVIAEWLTNGRRLPTPGGEGGSDISVNEMLLAYLNFADKYFVKHGEPTTEPESIRLSMRPVRELYGTTMAKNFGPLQLKAVRQKYIDSGLCRGEVNKRIGRVVRIIKWAVGEAILPPSAHHALLAVAGLRKGRSEVREAPPVKPVPDADVAAIQPFVSRQTWAMIEIQLHSGMRPQEVCLMRTCDVDTTGRVWVYSPSRHKTEHHGRERNIHLGPKAQAVLKPWFRDDPEEYLFSPREAMEERSAQRRRDRVTPLTPSQRKRTRKARPKRGPGDRYNTRSYYHAVAFGIAAANKSRETQITPWHPNQLRHSAATRLRKEFGIDAARAVLGHASPTTTEVYAEIDAGKAAEAMAKLG